MKERKDSGQKK